jgi:peptidoglycan/xylan/chitin deacetylase (PgdA/CDA1 family)
MNVFLTFDYELFFGSNTGTVEKCMLEPTQELLRLAQKHGTPMTFFVDVGYLICLEKWIPIYPQLQRDYELVTEQLQQILQQGSDIQLHIHPHWEQSVYDGNKWIIHTENCYKLSDFPLPEIERIVRTYKQKLDALTGRKSHSFRAGGWCIQPFNLLEHVFSELGIKYDSSVFPGGHFEAGAYAFDFRNAPRINPYRFQSDVCIATQQGEFTEYAIGSYRYSPWFYWRLYAFGKINRKAHHMWGDGQFMSQPGRKKQVLTHFTWNHASTDGYYASKLKTITEMALQTRQSDLVFIGHPKGNTLFSVRMLDRYLRKFKNRCTFLTFGQLR